MCQCKWAFTVQLHIKNYWLEVATASKESACRRAPSRARYRLPHAPRALSTRPTDRKATVTRSLDQQAICPDGLALAGGDDLDDALRFRIRRRQLQHNDLSDFTLRQHARQIRHSTEQRRGQHGRTTRRHVVGQQADRADLSIVCNCKKSTDW